MTIAPDDECPHSPVLTPATCSICLDPPSTRPKVTRKKTGDPFPARHEAQCPSCDLPISPGQPIQRWSDGKYRHAEGDRPCTP